MAPTAPISLLELHDSRVAAVALVGGDGTLEFSHLAVYHAVAPDRAEVWSYKATLEMKGIESFSIDGLLPRNGEVIDGEMRCEADRDSRLIWMLAPAHGVEMQLVFESGAKLKARAQHARMRLDQAIRMIDEFTDDK